MAGVNSDHGASAGSLSAQGFASKLLLVLTALLLTLAALAFVLQWRGGMDDPASRSPAEHEAFPGMGVPVSSFFSSVSSPRSPAADCVDIFGAGSATSFSYFNGWKFDANSDLRPRICITTSTSAGLEQILPWVFYHKVIGVTTFFMFVEGKAAKPSTSAILESIPGVKVIHRNKDLEEKQAKSNKPHKVISGRQ